MDYYKITITFSPFEEWLRDILTAQLAEIGFEGFSETECGTEAFISEIKFQETKVTELFKPFEKNYSFRIKKEVIKSQNWNEVWEKNYFQPLIIAGECLVRAPFHTEFPSCTYEIVIEPNMAFGTGNHETTSMMLEAILKENVKGKKILDMGCGTGILGILASKKGAAEIISIDIDEWSVQGTQENAVLNEVKNLKVLLGDASLLHDYKFDLIFANIHKNVLISDIPVYAENLTKEGKLYLSGIYLEDLKEIREVAENKGLKFLGYQKQNNWITTFFQS